MKLIAASPLSACKLTLLLTVLSCIGIILPVGTSIAGDEPTPTADQLLQDVVAQLPAVPLSISGKLIVRRRRGVPVATYPFTLETDWGARPATAAYRIDNSFGQSLEQLKIIHGADNKYEYSAGDPLLPASLKSLSAPIQKTDLSWMDLTLSFLWWKGGRIIGEESIRTFNCYIVEVDAPPSCSYLYASVKLWISKKNHLMLQAEGYNAKDEIIRRLWIKSCKKIDDEWMIKDMEIQRYPKAQMTKLRVTSVEKTEPEIATSQKEAQTARTEP